MHGAIFLNLKTEGQFHHKVRGWVNNAIIFFVIMYGILTVATFLWVPHMVEKFKTFPVLFLIPVVNVLAVANVPRAIHQKKDFLAFLSSCAAIILLMFLLGLGMFPNLVLSNPHPEFSLSIYNASSSIKTLQTMLLIVLIGMPLVVAYTVSIYWIFRGKVKVDQRSY